MREIAMTKLFTATTKFIRDEEGATLAEYGLLLALIAVVCLAAITVLGTKISSMFSDTSNSI
jgi:pilus assembly protein Flp/PilA